MNPISFFLILWLLFSIVIEFCDIFVLHKMLTQYGKVEYDIHQLFIIVMLVMPFVCSKITELIFSFKKNFRKELKEYKYKFSLAFTTIIIVSFFWIFNFFSFNFIEDIINDYYLEQSHIKIGLVSKKYKESRNHDHLFVVTSVNLTDTKHYDLGRNSIDNKYYRLYYNDIKIGDTIILRVSDKYPCVNEVINWNPSKKEIAKYKTPVGCQLK